jgi:hypothetical protein
MKIENFKLKIVYLLICLLGYLFIAQITNASPLSLSVDPPITVINAVPPTATTNQLSIQNESDKQVALQIQLKPFKPRGENGELEYFKGALEIFKNIQILDGGTPVETIVLGPKQQKVLTLNIDIPKNITTSDYYFSVIFISINSSIASSNSSKSQIGIATNVLLSVGSPEISKAALEEFSSGIFFEAGPIPFRVRVRNKGVHLIHPTGKITIQNMFGQNIGKLDLASANVLSNSTRAIPDNTYIQESKLTDNSGVKTNNFEFRHPEMLWKENFLIGLYTATLDISMSDGGSTLTRTIHFFAFPFQGLIIIIIAIITIIVFIDRVKQYTNKNQT